MATVFDVLDAINRIEKAGHAGDATMTARLEVSGPPLLPQDYDRILGRLAKAFPDLVSASPPPSPGPEQQGHAAEAMKKAESALSQQQSATAEFDRQLIEAILHAHMNTGAARKQLDDLETEIESAARTWDLSTPAGAREFQKFLLGKLYQIIELVQRANDDDTSKQALAAALAALYASVPGEEPSRAEAPAGGDAPSGGDTSTENGAPGGGDALPDSEVDPYLDDLAGDELKPVGEFAPQRSAPDAAPIPAAPGFGAGTPGGGAMPVGGVPGGMPLAGLPQDLQRRPASEYLDDEPLLADDMMPADEAAFDEPAEEQTDEKEAAPEVASGIDPTTVTLPNGERVSAATPQLAAVMQAAVSGTPIADAFRQQGITIPPPGTAVAGPVDQSRVSAGDIGMFTDRHALALGDTKALLDGQIQYIGNVRGPSFLGWQHPPTTGETASPTPTPTPTLPSATART
jgi:hypothetical protein